MGTRNEAGDLPEHDDVYAAVFKLVGQQPNETYEGLTKVLPSIKDKDPAELKELAARRALRDMFKPSVDPLRLEYEQAAADEDVDDLSTEDGDWLIASNKERAEDDEEVDEHGIPVMKLSRASSNFILDGPGDVKVDNFTPEAGDDDVNPSVRPDGSQAPGSTAAPAAGPAAPSTSGAGGSLSAASAAVSAGSAAIGSYVPNFMARARRSTAGGGSTAAPVAGAGAVLAVDGGKGAAAAVAAAPAVPVVTLEDEIRAMRARGAAAAAGIGAGGGAASPPPPTSSGLPGPTPASAPLVNGDNNAAKQQQQQQGKAECDGNGAAAAAPPRYGAAEVDEDPEVVLEPPSPQVLLPQLVGESPSLSLLSSTQPGAVNMDEAAGGGTGGPALGHGGSAAAPNGMEAGGSGIAAVAAKGGKRVQEEPTCLPGECQDSSGEDAVWRALQGVDPRALLEHMGLAGPTPSGDASDGDGDAGEAGDAGGLQGTAGAAAQQEAEPQQQQQQQQPPEAAAAPGQVEVGEVGAAGASGVADGPGGPRDAGGSCSSSGGGGGGGAGVGASEGGSGQQLAVQVVQPKAAAAAPGAGSGAASGGGGGGSGGSNSGGCRGGGECAEGPVFEAVEAFSLDPDFDYDNVVLTPREFPYSMLTARRAAGAGQAGAAGGPR